MRLYHGNSTHKTFVICHIEEKLLAVLRHLNTELVHYPRQLRCSGLNRLFVFVSMQNNLKNSRLILMKLCFLVDNRHGFSLEMINFGAAPAHESNIFRKFELGNVIAQLSNVTQQHVWATKMFYR